MRVNPIQPTTRHFMRFGSNNDTTPQPQPKTEQQPNPLGNKRFNSFQQVFKEIQCQPIKPQFTGHWPQYKQHNAFESTIVQMMTVIPTDGKRQTGTLTGTTPIDNKTVGRKLNFIA